MKLKIKLKKQLAIKAHHEWSEKREWCCDCGDDFTDGYLTGFVKAREINCDKILGAIEAIDRYLKMPNVGEKSKAEHKFLIEHLETLHSISTEIGEEVV